MDLTKFKKVLQKNKWWSLLPVGLIAILIVVANNFNAITATEHRFTGYLKNFVSQNNDNQLVVIEYSPEEINRAEIAGLIQTLSDVNARSILLDLDLTNPSIPELDDNMLSLTLKANNRGRTVLPVYSDNGRILKPLRSFSKHAKKGYIDLNFDYSQYHIPIELNLRTSATKYTHAVLQQLGRSGSEYSNTIIEPGLDINNITKYSFAQIIGKSSNQKLANKHILIGPSSPRTNTHALLFNTLVNGEVYYAPKYIVFVLILVFASLLAYVFFKYKKRSTVISLALLVLMLPIALNVLSVLGFRSILPAISLSAGLASIILYLAYIHYEKLSFAFASDNIEDENNISDESQALLEGEISIGKNGVILKVDPIVTKILGYNTENLVGRPFRDIVSEFKHEKWRSFYEMLKKLDSPDNHIYDLKAKHANGKIIKIQLQPNNFMCRNNISAHFLLRKTLGKTGKQVTLEYQAKHDEISSTLNKAGIIEYLSNEISNAQDNTSVSIIVFRLANFNEINNALDENATNKILKRFSSRLYKYTDENTVIGRILAAEFLLVRTYKNGENKDQDLAYKIIRSCKNAIHTSGISIELSLHAGIANYPSHGKSAKQLIVNARTALKAAIENQDTVKLFSKKSDKFKPKPKKKFSEIQKALKENQFRLYYQPIISLKDYSVSSVEALLRWEHPEQGLLLPSSFIDKVENSKLVRPVTAWVINRALSDAHSWKKHGLNIKISVNISERNLLDAHFPKLVDECLKRNKMNPSKLELEISEKSLLSVSEQSIKVLNRLIKRGIKFTLDNYGKGNASLVYLRKLPISTIKIDKSLTSNVIKSKEDEAIIDAIVRMAQGLDIAVVAEGVESELHYKKLKHLNFDYSQGHLFSRPVSRKELIRLFEAWENTFYCDQDDEIPAESMATWNGQYNSNN